MLVLVRHGESEANAAGLLLGRTDSPLSAHGVRQAAALAGALGAVNRVLSSPLERARHTAAALARGRPVEIDQRWVEVDYGEFEGQALSDVPADIWQRWRREPEFRPPGGESLGEVARRVRGACEELFAEPGRGARAPDGDVVVVSHVSPIKAAVAWALGVDHPLDWRLHLSTGSLTRIGWGSEGPSLHTFNSVPPAEPPVAHAAAPEP
jgi:broad specificity phosphatase PhoE